MRFTGVYTAIITPLKQDESFDRAAFEKLIEFQIAEGVDGIVVLGTTGESPTVTHTEHKMILKEAVDIVSGRTRVIAGSGSNCTREALELSEAADRCGCDALLVVNPYYNKPTQKGLYLHFKAVAEAVDVPVILYNIKGRSGVNLETDTLLRLAEIDNISAVKEASGDMEQIRDVINRVPDDFDVLSGDDNLTFEIMKLGGRGVVSVLSNILPGPMKAMTHAALQGNLEVAESINSGLSELFELCFIETNPQPIKTMLAAEGFCEEVFRLPMTSMLPENRNKVLAALESYKVGHTG